MLPTAIKHTPSEPVMVRSELSESLPTLPSHRVPPQDTATALGTSVVTDTTAKVCIMVVSVEPIICMYEQSSMGQNQWLQ